MLAVMEASADKNQRALDLVPVIEANQAFSHYMRSQRSIGKKITDWTAEVPQGSDSGRFLTRRLVGLLGKRSVRNLVVAIRLARMTQPKLPRKKGEALEIEPTQLIPFALQAEELCTEQSWAYPEMAFTGGLHYDWALALLARNKAPKEASEALKAAFAEGLQVARRAYRLSERLKNLKYGKFVFPSALVAPLGQGLMPAFFKMADFAKGLEDYGRRKAKVRPWLEKEFEFTSSELSSLFVTSLQLLREVEPAIRYAREPALLAGGNPGQQALAMVLSVAWAYTGFVPGKNAEESPLGTPQKSWLQRNRLAESDVRAFK
jgi:hypothetical protein